MAVIRVASIVWVSALVLYTVLVITLFGSSPQQQAGNSARLSAAAMFRPQFLLFGDSITQKSFSPRGGWGAALADTYQRKVDVINRGYSGYNSRWALQLLDRVLPEEKAGRVQLATVFFGANDAALPDQASSRQHVPVAEYAENLRTIVARLHRLRVPAIVLITPPPISEPDRIVDVERKYGVRLEAPERTNEAAGKYAAACVELAQELGIPVLNLWAEFQKEAGWQQGLLEDGLHLNERGNAKVAKLLTALIAKEFPQLRPEAMADDAPTHAEVDGNDPATSFKQFYEAKKKAHIGRL